MSEIDRLSGDSDWIDLEFMQRERTPEQIVEVGIQLRLAGLSFSNIIQHLENSGVKRSRTAIHNWVQKAELQPTGTGSSNYVALDETVIQLGTERYWLDAAVDPEMNEFLHVRLFPTRPTVFTKQFLQELQEKHEIADAVFLADGAPWLQAALFEGNLRFQHVTHGNRNAAERIFKEVKQRTEQFANHFCHASVESAGTWLQTSAFAWNQLI